MKPFGQMAKVLVLSPQTNVLVVGSCVHQGPLSPQTCAVK